MEVKAVEVAREAVVAVKEAEWAEEVEGEETGEEKAAALAAEAVKEGTVAATEAAEVAVVKAGGKGTEEEAVMVMVVGMAVPLRGQQPLPHRRGSVSHPSSKGFWALWARGGRACPTRAHTRHAAHCVSTTRAGPGRWVAAAAPAQRE